LLFEEKQHLGYCGIAGGCVKYPHKPPNIESQQLSGGEK